MIAYHIKMQFIRNWRYTMTELKELMEALTISIAGTQGTIELAGIVDVYKDDKLNLKNLGKAGLIFGKDLSTLNVELQNDSNRVAYADIAIGQTQWKVIADSDDSTTLIDRTGTYKSGQKDVEDSKKLLDMRFDITHIVREMIKQFFPQLKLQGSSDGIRSKYAHVAIDSITMLIEAGVSEDKIQSKLKGDNISQEVWDKMMASAKAEVKESA